MDIRKSFLSMGKFQFVVLMAAHADGSTRSLGGNRFIALRGIDWYGWRSGSSLFSGLEQRRSEVTLTDPI